MVRAPGNLSSGQHGRFARHPAGVAARTGRQTPVDGAGRPLGTGNRDIERPENAPVERIDASLDTLRVLQRDGAGRLEEQGTGMAADAILNNADLPGVSGAERPDL